MIFPVNKDNLFQTTPPHSTQIFEGISRLSTRDIATLPYYLVFPAAMEQRVAS